MEQNLCIVISQIVIAVLVINAFTCVSFVHCIIEQFPQILVTELLKTNSIFHEIMRRKN